ncbi:MAG: polysaccharide biosynthesis/export family protein [Candidatus Acidiferrales bacterium]
MTRIKSLGILLSVLFLIAPANVFGQKGPSSQPPTNPNSPAASNSTAQSDADRPALEHRYPRYRVMRDDILNVSFPLSPELNQSVSVQPDGYITLLNIGTVYVQGMTVPEITEALKKAYSKTLHDPIIDVDLKDFQKPFFVVSGQVAKPGQYDLRYDTTVSQGIAIAGGLVPTAKTQLFIFHRVSSGTMEVKKFNLKEILDGKNVNEDAFLQPGDMIFIPEKFITNFRKYVPYNVGLYATPTPAWF